MIKAVLFDIGWVTNNADSMRAFGKVAKKINVGTEDLHNAYRRSKVKEVVNKRTFKKEVRKLTGKNHDLIEDWHKGYLECLKDVNKDVIKTVKKLKKNYKVGALTNANSLHHEWRKEAGAYDLFDPVICSATYRTAKPQQKLYRIALKKLKLPAKEVVFVDDHWENIETARKIGMKGILFKNNILLLRELKKLGVTI